MFRRVVAVSLIALTSLFILSGAPAEAKRERGWRKEECRYLTLDGRKTWNQTEVKMTIRCASNRFGVSTSTALMVASHESGFVATARNPDSGACGIFQHLPRYWGSRINSVRSAWPRYARYGSPCTNARSNIFAAMLMVKRGGWYPWCGFTTYC